MEVILVEDDVDLCDTLEAGLGFFDILVRSIYAPCELDAAFAQHKPVALLLDIQLPGESGLSIARRYRTAHPALGIVMLTAQGDIEHRLQGFEGGADLYFVKPVDHRELAAALKNLARRLPVMQTQWRIDIPHSLILAPDGSSMMLTHIEVSLLELLAGKAGTVIPRKEIFIHLREPDDEYAAQRLETLLSRLRSRMRGAGLPPLPVKARHRVGYVFHADAQVKSVGTP